MVSFMLLKILYDLFPTITEWINKLSSEAKSWSKSELLSTRPVSAYTFFTSYFEDKRLRVFSKFTCFLSTMIMIISFFKMFDVFIRGFFGN